MFHVPNRWRWRNHPTHGSTEADGNHGAFSVPLADGVFALCIAADGSAMHLDEWEHVSVSIHTSVGTRLPTWPEMCAIKDVFWDASDCVVQFHPPRKRYVNDHPHVLHLWRSVTYRQPMPPLECV